MTYETIIVDTKGKVGIVRLNRPQALNALNAKVNAELDKSGVPIDLTELKPQHLEDLIDQLDDVTVDVNDPGSQMQVFCE